MLNRSRWLRWCLTVMALFILLTGFYFFAETYGYVRGGKSHLTMEKLADINLMLYLYKKDLGRCPTPQEGWGGIKSKYGLQESMAKDSWGNGFAYTYSENGVICGFYSIGENGVDEMMAGDDLSFRTIK